MPTGTPVSVLSAWAEAARLVGTQFELDYSFDPQPYGDIYTIVVTEGTPR